MGEAKKQTPGQTDTNFQSIHMEWSPFLFWAYRTDMAKQETSVFDRQDSWGAANAAAAFNMSGFTVHAQQILCLAGLTAQDHHNRLELQAGPLSFRC